MAALPRAIHTLFEFEDVPYYGAAPCRTALRLRKTEADTEQLVEPRFPLRRRGERERGGGRHTG